jgi:aminodeoxyfutalosine synthase
MTNSNDAGADLKVGPYQAWSSRLAAGEHLTPADVAELASTHDILSVGMLADEIRRRTHGARVTFARVACCPFDKPLAEAVPLTAREVRLTGAPESLDVAVTAVRSAKAVAGARLLSGFSLVDLQAFANGEPLKQVLRRLHEHGLEMIAEVPIDKLPSPDAALEALASAGYERVRLTMARPAAGERVTTLLRAVELSERFPQVQMISPLPLSLATFRPTTGYDDVKVVALARLAAPERVRIQVDWQRYGPKLAQVALTFGADDVDNVSPSDDAPEGRRRAPLEEVRRNIEAAGFTPVERDGRFITS